MTTPAERIAWLRELVAADCTCSPNYDCPNHLPDKETLATLLCDAMEALEALYGAYCSVMSSEFDFPGRPWTPERDNDTDALSARAVLARFATMEVQ